MFKRSILLLAFAVLVTVTAFSAIKDYDRNGCTLGRWTHDIDAARRVAKENGTVILVSFMKNDGSCGVCNSVSQSLLETDGFKDWAKNNKIPLLIADYAGSTKASREIDCAQYESFPVFVIIDGADGTTRLAWFYVTNVQSGNGTAPDKPMPKSGFMISGIKSEIYTIIQRLVALQNNSGVAKTATGANRHRNAAAFTITPDAKDADTLTIQKIRNLPWENSLGSRHWINGKVIWAFYDDQFDWWKFENAEAGTSYEIKTPLLNDPGELGQVCVFTNIAQVTAVSDLYQAEQKALQRATPTITPQDCTAYSLAMETAYWKKSMKDLAADGVFDAPVKGEIYILFTRRNVTGFEEDITLDYSFTIQEVNKTAYSFAKLEQHTDEDVGTLKIPITRSSDVGAGKVTVSIEAAGAAGYAEAVEGADKDYVIANKTVEFANGAATADLEVSIARGEVGIESPKRAFKIVLQSDNEPETGYLSTTVFIEDSDVEEAIAPDLDATKKNVENTVMASLNGDNVQDAYYLTNATESAGSVYTFAVDPVEGGIRNFADGRIKVKLTRDGNVIAPEAGAKMDANGYAWVTNNYVFYLFGSDSVAGKDVKIEVAREAAAAGEFPNVKYKMTWWRFDRPKVSLADDDAEFASGQLPTNVTFNVEADSIQKIKELHEPFELPVAWSTVAPASGTAAVAGADYAAVVDGVCTFTTDGTSVAVDVFSQDKVSYPTRSFDVQLKDPAANAFYVLGERKSAKVKLTEDDVSASPACDIQAPVGAEWASTGDDVRRLNYTNTVDWIKVENVIPTALEYEYTTNYLMTATNEVIDAKIEVVGEGESANTNFTAKLKVMAIDYTSKICYDGTSDVVTNSITVTTNDYSVAFADELGGAEESAWPYVASQHAKTLKGESVACVSNEVAARLGAYTYYRLQAQDVMTMPAHTSLTVDICTNRADDAAVLYSYELSDLVFDDLAAAPVMHFDALTGGTVWLRVSRKENEDVRAEYKLSLRKWEKPVFRFSETSVSSEDVAPCLDLVVFRDGNTEDVATVKIVASNKTESAGSDYFSVPETLTFDAGKDSATLTVTITDPDWNARVWTGDRSFALTVAEVYPVGAFDLDAASNRIDVALRETNGGGLDEADGKDETRADVTTNDVAFAIADDGALTSLVRTLNGLAAEGCPNDTNDWFRFTGIVSNETYCFKAVDCLVSNAEVSVEFFVGDSETAVNTLTLDELAATGWRYTAQTNADVIVRVSRTSGNKVASVNYTLEAYRYVWPVVGFSLESDTLVVTNTALVDSGIPLEVFRNFNTNETIRVRFAVNVRDEGWEKGYFTGAEPTEIDFAPAESATSNVVVRLAGFKDDVWVGDWTCTLALSADPDMVRFGRTNVTVKVVDSVAQKDVSDPADDAKAGAAALAFAEGTESVVTTNHLNGIDFGRDGAYSDTSDWVSITGIEAGNYYRLTLPEVSGLNYENVDATVAIECTALVTNIAFAALKDGGYIDVPATDANDIFVCVARNVLTEEKPVSLKYVLNVEKIAWPTFEISAESPVANDCGTAYVVVTRTGNAEHDDSVVVNVTDANDVKVTQPFAPQTVAFEPGETGSKTVGVAIVSAAAGFWKRGGDFTAALAKADASQYVTFSDPAEATVTVTDASGIPGNDCPEDDDPSTAPSYVFDTEFQAATSNAAAGQDVAWLNGDDVVDYYRFSDSKKGRKYRFFISDFAANNADGLEMTFNVYAAKKADVEDIASDAELVVTTNLLDLVRTDASEKDVKLDVVAEGTNGFVVVVRRGVRADADVSVAYMLNFRSISPSWVRFAADTAEVSEAAEFAYVDVVCSLEGDETLDAAADVVLRPVEDEDGQFPATAETDFDVTPIPLSWAAGTTGGAQRVAIRMGNRNTDWQGDRTFALALETQSETEVSESHGRMTITIVEKDTPIPGTVGIVTVNGAAASTTAKPLVREGDVLEIGLERVGGRSGAVSGTWTWAIGKDKQVTNAVLFADREDGTKTIGLVVPTTPGFQMSQDATLSLAFGDKTMKATAKTPTSLKFALSDSDYGDTVASYSAGDASKVAFRTSGAAWYVNTSGALASSTPAAGGFVTMVATVTGPGTLRFSAALTDCVGCTVQAKVGAVAQNVVDGVNEVPVAAGTKTVQIVLTRPKSGGADTASVAISDVEFIRSDFSTGSFNGTATVTEGGVTMPGLAALSVSAAGVLSGKIQTPTRMWVFSAKGGWENGNKKVTARNGTTTFDIALTLDADTGTVAMVSDGSTPAVTMSAALTRNPWADKPLGAAAAAVAAMVPGYYTVALPDASGQSTFGSGFLTVTVRASGTVSAAGVLADGQAVSASSTLQLDSSGKAFVTLYASPSSYAKGWFAKTLGFEATEAGVVVTPKEDPVEKCWVRKSSTGAFERAVGASGGWYSKLASLYGAYYANDFTPASLAVAGYDALGLDRISYAKATGRFTGTVKASYTADGRTRTKSAACQGVITPLTAEGDASIGRGFFLLDGESKEISLED